MSSPFVWFDHVGKDPGSAADFYRELFGWQTSHDKPSEGGYVGWIHGGEQPWAGFALAEDDGGGRWIPYVQVTDLDRAVDHAASLGASIVQARRTGPAGDAVVVADPTGALLALWAPAVPASGGT